MFLSGIGYDTHQLVVGRPLILGGVTIPYEKGLLGHSDADVLIHAIIDALTGAAGLPDIGRLFPDTEKNYANIDSRILLKRVVDLVSKNHKIINIDSIIICQAPKLAPHIPQMISYLKLDTNCERVNVKATTTEKMNDEGRGNCISSQAICMLGLP